MVLCAWNTAGSTSMKPPTDLPAVRVAPAAQFISLPGSESQGAGGHGGGGATGGGGWQGCRWQPGVHQRHQPRTGMAFSEPPVTSNCTSFSVVPARSCRCCCTHGELVAQRSGGGATLGRWTRCCWGSWRWWWGLPRKRWTKRMRQTRGSQRGQAAAKRPGARAICLIWHDEPLNLRQLEERREESDERGMALSSSNTQQRGGGPRNQRQPGQPGPGRA